MFYFPLHCFTSRISITSIVENSVDPNQLASKKPADLDLHYFQTGYIPAQQGKKEI